MNARLAPGDAAVHGIADAGVAAALQAQVADECVHCSAFGGSVFAQRPLQLRSIQQHLLHCQHVHQRVCRGVPTPSGPHGIIMNIILL